MKTLTIALVAIALTSTGPALADEWKDKAKLPDKKPEAEASQPAKPDAGEKKKSKGKKKGHKPFSSGERDEINAYYGANPEARSQLPPGLAKKNKLPPGWQKKLAPGQRIPDDVWAHRVPVPKEVKVAEEPGVVRVRIDDRVVKVAERTREVLDVFEIVSGGHSVPPR